jgi:hypothetical protein
VPHPSAKSKTHLPPPPLLALSIPRRQARDSPGSPWRLPEPPNSQNLNIFSLPNPPNSNIMHLVQDGFCKGIWTADTSPHPNPACSYKARQALDIDPFIEEKEVASRQNFYQQTCGTGSTPQRAFQPGPYHRSTGTAAGLRVLMGKNQETFTVTLSKGGRSCCTREC